MSHALPAHHYSRNPRDILIAKENSIENRLKGCKGCRYLTFDASGERIYATCDRGRKVGRKGKCTKFKENE
jgi:hypothetical protein